MASKSTNPGKAADFEEEERRLQEYNKAYYKAHREHILRKVSERTQLVRGTDAFREKLVEDLNSGKRKFVKQPTRDRLNLQQDPRTLRWL